MVKSGSDCEKTAGHSLGSGAEELARYCSEPLPAKEPLEQPIAPNAVTQKDGSSSQNAEDIAFPTTLERAVSTPGAFAIRGINEDEPVAPPLRNAVSCDLTAPASDLITATLVDDEEEGSESTRPESLQAMEIEKAEALHAERLGWTPSRCQFRMLLAIVAITVVVSIVLGVILSSSQGDGSNTQSLDGVSQEEPEKGPPCRVLGSPDIRSVHVNNFAAWGMIPSNENVTCLEARPRATISCSKNGGLTLLQEENTSCQEVTRADSDVELSCITPARGVARVAFQCSSKVARSEFLRGMIRLSHEAVVQSPECQASLVDQTFVTVGLFCRNDRDGLATIPVNSASCRGGSIAEKTVTAFDLNICCDTHQNTTIDLEMSAKHPDKKLIRDCLVHRSCRPPLSKVQLSP